MSHYKETQKKYTKLPSHQKTLLRLLALIDSPLTRTKTLQVCTKSKIKTQGNKAYSTVNIGKELETLKSLGLVKKTINQKYQINPDAYDFVMRQSITDKKLSTMLQGVYDVLPGIHSNSYYNRTIDSILRDACFALYTHNYQDFTRALNLAQSNYTINRNTIYHKFFVKRYGADKIHELPQKFQLEFYRLNLVQRVHNLEDVTPILKQLKKLSPKLDEDDLDFVLYYQSLHAILKGDWNTILKLWNGKESIQGWRFMGWLNFIQGNNNQALVYYEKALKAYRKKEKSRKAYFQDIHGAIYILALLKDDNSKHIATIKQFFKEVFARGLSNLFLILSTIVEALQNNPTRAEELYNQEYLYYDVNGLFYLLGQYWTQIHAPNWENYAYTLHHKAKKNGYHWLAYNIAALMEQISTNKTSYYENSAQELHAKIDRVPPILDTVAIREDWEIALQALDALSNTNVGTNNNQQTRLIWLVDFETELIQPKIQRVNKNGKWSKGRNATLSKLAYGEIDEATAHDNRIARTLSKDYGWYGNQSYGFFDLDQTFKAMVGHPLLFLMKSPDIACELQKGTPELIVKELSQGYEIQASMDISMVGYHIHKETPTRYKFIEITPEQVQLYQALGGQSLLIPQKGKAKLEKVLTNLTTIIPLQSDLLYQDDSIPSIDGDHRIYVHLLPVGDGFHVEFFVKPFSSTPPYFKPGEGSIRVIALVHNIRTQTERDLDHEKMAVQQVIEACPILKEMVPNKGVWQLETPFQCLELLRDLETLKLNNTIAIEWPKGEKLKIKRHINFDNLQLSISKDNDWFGISGKIHVDENLILDMRQLLNMMQQQKSEFIELDNGQFLALSKKLQKHLNSIHKFTDDHGKIHPLAGFALEDLTHDVQDLEIDQAWTNHIENLKSIEQQNFDVPNTLNAELRSYQKEGYQWLSKLAAWGVGACLADDMGLGKTIQALTLILQRTHQGPSLVVAPASVCRNWVKEIEKFAPSLTPILFRDTNRERTIKQAKAQQVLITTYGLLQSESKLFASQNFTTIVLDEAQAIKNSSAKRSQAAMQLQGDYKIITTGTPIENHLNELWNLFRFINPGLLGSARSFRNRFAIPIEKDRDQETQEQLQRLIRPFILRRHKREVLKELPEKTEVVLTVELSAEEQAFYEAMRREAVASLEKNADEQAGTQHLKVLAQLMRLRRACCNPKLVNPETPLRSSKLELFGNVVEELLANGHKALIFSQFVGHLQLIEEYVRQKGIAYQYLDGQTPPKQRQARIDAFQDGQGDLFLISLKAGGTGLNLTAADYVIHMDPWWNPAVEDQASDRAHRIGQKRPVTVYRLITQNTIEEKIIKLHESKRDLADSLLKGTDSSSKLSAQDLLDLIKNQ